MFYTVNSKKEAYDRRSVVLDLVTRPRTNFNGW